LNIPFVTLDLEKEYKKGVIDYMIDEYKRGRTPNPDVMCNREVKFGVFLKWALKNNADFVATGHYAQNKSNQLKISKDENKDQTYFLWTLKQEQLKHILFPVGHLEKDEVRNIAEKNNLIVARKKDSQGLCFIGTIDIKTLLKNYIEEKKGDVKNGEGEIIGHHDGVMFFTIGERHGFTITKKSTDDKPYFVTAKDFNNNTLIVSNDIPHEEKGEIIPLEQINWTKKLNKGEIYEARARYRAPLGKVEVIDNTHIKIIDENIVVARGQSLVLYDGDICIGGGIIM
jgi:tRNA-specific 2-thiouridylase